jgi:hypothetical protein
LGGKEFGMKPWAGVYGNETAGVPDVCGLGEKDLKKKKGIDSERVRGISFVAEI